MAIVVAGHGHADKVAEDNGRELAVSHVRSQLQAARPGDEPLLTPAPGAGFAGA
ncbi:hypothetical protein BJ122_12446 [Rhodopseudomonas faecalis]|uniref:Uncharacterized protein n=2 Tax=Rhodopseudomonas faecalis TaxID=99655 RepID=A0A318T9L1_9BRAD|nr:hypothetical protein BJ122_12446 [Rhodopseudomonas faecalis]